MPLAHETGVKPSLFHPLVVCFSSKMCINFPTKDRNSLVSLLPNPVCVVSIEKKTTLFVRTNVVFINNIDKFDNAKIIFAREV